MYFSTDVVGYCGTEIRSYLELLDIKTGEFRLLNELPTGLIVDVYPNAYIRHSAYLRYISVNEFFSGLANARLVKNPNEISLMDDVMENLHNTYKMNKSLVQIFLRASYDDELQGHKTRTLVVQSVNAGQVQFISQVLMQNENFNDYTLFGRRMTAFVGPPGVS